MSLQYLKDAVASGDTEALIRYVRLHLGDGDEARGRKEIDKAWIVLLAFSDDRCDHLSQPRGGAP